MSEIIKNFEKIKYGPAPEDSKEVHKWIKKQPSPNNIFIDGKWIRPNTKKIIQSISPSNNKKLFKLSESSKSDINKAVLSA